MNLLPQPLIIGLLIPFIWLLSIKIFSNQKRLKNCLYWLIPSLFLFNLLRLSKPIFFGNNSQNFPQLVFTPLKTIKFVFEANPVNLAFCWLVGIFCLNYAIYCLQSNPESEKQNSNQQEYCENLFITCFGLLTISALAKSFVTYLLSGFGFLIIVQNLVSKHLISEDIKHLTNNEKSSKQEQSSPLFFWFYLQNFLFFLSAILLSKLGMLEGFEGNLSGFADIDKNAWRVAFYLTTTSLFSFLLLPFWFFWLRLKKKLANLNRFLFAFLVIFAFGNFMIGAKIFSVFSQGFDFEIDIENFVILKSILLINISCATLAILTLRNLKVAIFCLFFHQLNFLLFEFLVSFEETIGLKFVAILGASCCFTALFFCLKNIEIQKYNLNSTINQNSFGISIQINTNSVDKGYDLRGLFYKMPINCIFLIMAILLLTGLFPSLFMLEKIQIVKFLFKQKSWIDYTIFILNFLSLIFLILKLSIQFFSNNNEEKCAKNTQKNRQSKTRTCLQNNCLDLQANSDESQATISKKYRDTSLKFCDEIRLKGAQSEANRQTANLSLKTGSNKSTSFKAKFGNFKLSDFENSTPSSSSIKTDEDLKNQEIALEKNSQKSFERSSKKNSHNELDGDFYLLQPLLAILTCIFCMFFFSDFLALS